MTRLLNWSAMIVFAVVASDPASPLELPEDPPSPELLVPVLLVPVLLVPVLLVPVLEVPELDVPELDVPDDAMLSMPASSPDGLGLPGELELQP